MGTCLSKCMGHIGARQHASRYAADADTPDIPDDNPSLTTVTTPGVHGQEPVMCIAPIEQQNQKQKQNPNLIVSGGESGKVVIHDYATGAIVCEWKEHKRGVNCLAICSDGDKDDVFSGSRDKSIKHWRWQGSSSGEESHSLNSFTGHDLVITALALGLDKHLFSGSRDATVRQWDTETAQCILTRRIIRNIVTSMTVLRNGSDVFVQAAEDLHLRVWDTRSADVASTWADKSLRNIPLCCRSSPSGNEVAVSYNGFDGAGCEVAVWDVRKGEVMKRFTGHRQAVYGVEYVSGHLVSCSKDGEVRVWNSSGSEAVSCGGIQGTSGPVLCVAECKDGDRAMFGGFDGSISVLDIPSLTIRAISSPSSSS